MSNQTSEASSSSMSHQFISHEKQEEQTLFLEPFYDLLTGKTFAESKTAIEYCRELCAEYGFTVKQEASTHKNIYVYCSREGLPDSLRNPKSNPQRKRPSKRCDCRWRVVLYISGGLWEFRKSLNPAAGKHNHELMDPEEIERNWPKDVIDYICELARLRMATQEIRTRVQAQFPDIHWNERRFYNRLSEERQKIKQRDATERTRELFQIWSKICTLAAGSGELSQFVKAELSDLHQTLIQTTQVDNSTLPDPAVFSDDSTENKLEVAGVEDGTCTPSARQLSKQNISNVPKGFIQVEVPRQTYYIKSQTQRPVLEERLPRGQKRGRGLEDNGMTTPEPTQKPLKKGKNKQPSLLPNEGPHQENTFQCRGPYSDSRSKASPNPPRINTAPIMRTNPSAHSSNHRQSSQLQPTSLVYAYDSNSMSLGSPLSGYVHTSFSNPYHMSAPHNPPSFGENEMQFQFDPSQTPIVRTNSQASNANSNTNSVSAINTNMQPHSISSKLPLLHSSYHQQQPQTTQNTPQPIPEAKNNQMSAKTQCIYSMNPSPIISNSNIKQNMNQISTYDTVTHRGSVSASSVEDQQHPSDYSNSVYLQQSHRRQDGGIMPVYNRKSSQAQPPKNDNHRANVDLSLQKQ
ncbi:hypothetical protein BY458DRAFT_273514 [Sporodiniella umbellata]|nr:hypothetical protein BY458DRAFT_273514 [Sporodiniella umbellata]